jgi:amino acid adenylation domain-containing protein
MDEDNLIRNAPQTETGVLEAYLRKASRGISVPATIPKRPDNCPIPLSYGQERMWFQTQLAPESPLFNESITIHKHGPLNVTALDRSLNEIIRRHEIWRTNFKQMDGQPVQVVRPPFNIDLPLVDLSLMPPEQRDAEAVRLATEDAIRPFDLVHDRLIRTRLTKWSDTEHRLFITLHHIIFDGISIYRVFLPELISLYRTFSTDSPCSLPELKVQYADYAYWQRHTMHDQGIQEQLNYWRDRLSGNLPVLQLPTDRPRPAVQSFRGAMQTLEISSALTADLTRFSNREGVTLYVTLLTAFATLIYRYTGQRDLPIGSVTAGRTHTELEGLIGFFLNTVVLRADLSEDPRFCDLLRRVREVTLEALCNDRIPFEYLVKELQPRRDLSVNPLFQTLFSLEPPLAPLDPDWKLSQMDVETGASKFDLYLELDERPEGIIGRFIYSTDIFNEATVRRMARHWQVLLRSIVLHSERPLSKLTLLEEDESRKLLVDFNDTRRDYPQKCIHEIFEWRVKETPDATALVFEKQRFTYRKLNERANQLAHRLRKLGVKPGVTAGIFLDRSAEMIVGLLGILKAGGAYVPLDTDSPGSRLDFVVRETDISVLLTQKSRADLVRTAGVHVICIEIEWASISTESCDNLNESYSPDDLAFILYTSGTTGIPKGIEIQNRSVVRLLFGVDYAHLGPNETFLQLAPLSFDASTFEIWGALLHGATCVVFPPNIPTPQDIRDVVRNNRVTILWLTSSLFNMLVDEAPESLLGVRQLLTGGETLSPVHVSLAYRFLPETQIINGYGPTESTTFTCCYRIPRESAVAASIPIGKPIANTQVYLLDPDLNPVPMGAVGELYIGGDGLARGYLNRPELTAEKFVANPFVAGTRMYRTGDVARYLESGDIEFLGRMDQQVKIRGFRIELGEIEAVLEEQAGVRQAVVVAGREEGGEKRLVAYYVVGAGEKGPQKSELRRGLKARLAEYMIPSVFVRMEALPLTANGKVDRKALPEAGREEEEGEGEGYVGAQDGLQRELGKIWEGVLGRGPIGIRDNFFDLGGHSLLAVRVMNRVEQAFGKRLPVATLFQAPTVEQLAGLLLQEGWTPPWSSLVVIQAGGTNPPFFCVHGIGGGVLGFRDLARRLGAEQPVYGLQAQGLDGKRPCHRRVEEMAAHYLSEIRSVQSEGPYYLGGLSFGGAVAFEMAQQLRAQGQEVGLVALFDTFPGKYESKTSLLLKFLSLPTYEKMRYLIRKSSEINSFARDLFLPQTLKNVRRACREAAKHYVPKVYPGHVVLFRASDKSLRGLEDPVIGWSELALGGVDVIEIAGSHTGIMDEPQVSDLARQLSVFPAKCKAAAEQIA